jgi:Amidases related to nicotinamidase
MTELRSLALRSQPFLDYLDAWYAELSDISLAELLGQKPERVLFLSVDMVNGFCCEGPLASPRVNALSEPIAALLRQAYDAGARHFVFTQDTHPADSPEFAAFPPHCVAGTSESEAVDALKALPFYDQVVTIPKGSLSSHLNTTFSAWLAEHPQIDSFVLVGDCSDLCIYSAAMHLRMEANALNIARRVIVPAALVETFDTPVEVARQLGIKAHDADLHHVLFLHHMALNGIEVVKNIRA